MTGRRGEALFSKLVAAATLTLTLTLTNANWNPNPNPNPNTNPNPNPNPNLLEAGGGGSTPPPPEGGQGGKLPRGALGLSWREWTSRGTRWLTRAAGGHCGKTTGEADCTDGESGVYPYN